MRYKEVPRFWISVAVVNALVLTTTPRAGYSQSPEAPEGAEPSTVSRVAESGIAWADIVKLVDVHPRMIAAKHQVAAARAGIDSAGSVPNPSIEATAAYGRARDSSAARVEWGLSLSIPFNWLTQRRARVDGAGAEARVTEAASEALRRDVLLELRLLFWSLVHEQERVSTLTALDHETAALAAKVRQRVEKSEARPVETTRVEIEAEKVAGKLAIARSRLKSRQAQLGLWLGVVDKQIRAVADLTELPQPVSVGAARTRASVTHPSVRAAEAKVQARSAYVSMERRARIPTFSLRAFTDHELDRSAYGAGLAVDLPLWNWNTGNIRRAEALLAAERSLLEAERMTLEASIIDAQAACQSGVTLAARYRDKIQPNMSSAVRTIERTYQLGEATLLEVLEARRTLLETKTQTLAALAHAQTECSRLAVLTGEAIP